MKGDVRSGASILLSTPSVGQFRRLLPGPAVASARLGRTVRAPRSSMTFRKLALIAARSSLGEGRCFSPHASNIRSMMIMAPGHCVNPDSPATRRAVCGIRLSSTLIMFDAKGGALRSAAASRHGTLTAPRAGRSVYEEHMTRRLRTFADQFRLRSRKQINGVPRHRGQSGIDRLSVRYSGRQLRKSRRTFGSGKAANSLMTLTALRSGGLPSPIREAVSKIALRSLLAPSSSSSVTEVSCGMALASYSQRERSHGSLSRAARKAMFKRARTFPTSLAPY
jgi:hypothetical protein